MKHGNRRRQEPTSANRQRQAWRQGANQAPSSEVKHATFVEKVWFDEAITCRPRAEIGIPATPDESFILHDDDTIATVQEAHRAACQASHRATSALGLDDIVRGNRRGPLPLRWVYLHVLRELAQHCGHADILREQITNR